MAQVLLIDDDEAMRKLVSFHVTTLGHQVVVTRNGKEALAAVKREPFDLVITDILMPEKDGIEIIIELKKSHPDIAVIAISGGGRISGLDYLEIARQLGVTQTLTKPFAPKTLGSAIKKALRSKPPPGGAKA